MKRLISYIVFAIFVLEQSTFALRLPGAMVAATVEGSAVQAAVGQPQLYCGQDRNGVTGCWNRQKYDQWAQQNGRVEQYRVSQGANRGLTDYERQHLVIPAPPDKSAPPKEIPLRETTTLEDPRTGLRMQVDLGSPVGMQIKEGASVLVGAAITAVGDFQQRAAAYAQFQQAYQNFYNQTAQQNADLAARIQAQANQIESQAEAEKSVIFPNMALSLAKLPMKNLSSAQLAAIKKAQQMEASALSHRTYEMNETARLELENSFKNALAEREFAAVFDSVEPLTRSLVDGKARVFASAGIINSEGVVHIGNLTQGKLASPLDSRQWQTPKETSEGEIVRRLANKYQKIYLESNGLRVLKSQEKARFVLGQMALGLGDQNLARGFFERGSTFLAMADTLVDSLLGMPYGAGEGLLSFAKSIPEMGVLLSKGVEQWWEDPVASWGAVAAFAADLPELGGMIPVILSHKYQEMRAATDFERGKILGRALFDVALSIGAVGEVKIIQSLSSVEKFEAAAAMAASASLKTAVQEGAVLEGLGKAAAPIAKAVEEMPAAAREVLVRYARSSPEVAVKLAAAKAKVLAQGEVPTARFIDKMMASDAPISLSEVDEVVDVHIKLMKELPQIPKTEFSGMVTRGIKKGQVPDGKGGMRSLTEADILELSPTNSATEHRFSIGGELGEKAQYFVIGGKAEAIPGIILELDAKGPAEVLFSETKVTSTRVLDTTDPAVEAVLVKLGIETISDPSPIYNFTQALGNAARANGFDGMIVLPSKMKGRNLVIFK